LPASIAKRCPIGTEKRDQRSKGAYVAFFQLAMILAGKTIYEEQHASDGRIDVLFSDPNQGDFVFEFKYLDPGSENKNKTFTTDDMAVYVKKGQFVPGGRKADGIVAIEDPGFLAREGFRNELRQPFS
jgi:hypothetical protein